MLRRMTKKAMTVPTPTPSLVTPGGTSTTLLDSEKAEALADTLVAQFQPVTDPSDAIVIQTVDVALRAYTYAPASESMLTSPVEVQDANQGLTFSKIPDSNGLLNRVLKHLLQSVIILQVAHF